MNSSKFFLSFVVIALLMWSGLTADAVNSTGSVTGTITDAETGEPIAGAAVNILVGATPEDPSGPFLALAESGVDGVYLSEDLESGSAALSIEASGYQRFEAFINILPGDIITVDAQLLPKATGNLQGTVVDSVSGQPVANPSVTLLVGATESDPNGVLWLVETDAGSSFSVAAVDAGSALLGVEAQGYQSYQIFITIVADETLTINPEMVLATESTETTETTEPTDPTLPFTGPHTAQGAVAVIAIAAGICLLLVARFAGRDQLE